VIHPPPTAVPLEVHARLPEELAGNRLGKEADPQLAHLPWFIEGPVADETGTLHIVDLAWGRILRMAPNGEVTVVADYEGRPNGLALDHDGTLLVADRTQGLLRLDPGDGTLSVVANEVRNTSFLGLNDLVMSRSGTLYVTDQGNSGLQDPNGQLLRFRDGVGTVILGNIPSPNGLALDDAEETLYLAATRDNAIWRVPLSESPVSRVGRYLHLSGGVGPDGIATGPLGTLLVAHLGMGVVWIFDERGVPVLVLQSPIGRYTTNVTFVPDSRRVFVTESVSGCVLTADLAEYFKALEVP
jgi:gluconolactonase